MVGLMFGIMVGLLNGLGDGGLKLGLIYGFGALIVTGLVAGLIAGLSISHALPVILAEVQLSMRWHTPLNLMNFLDDAHKRNILRTVGPVYQFRHARLQDRLTAAAANRPCDCH